jgi:hypothetical protein
MRNQDAGPLQPVHNLNPYKRVQGTHQIEHFFRAAAGLDVDKEDIKRYYDFVDQTVVDLLLVALSALERASGKINVLLARNPATALIPVSQEVVVFDTAPEDLDAIVENAHAADAAMRLDDYPAARALLYGLMSELRVRTYTLPLATYPAALTEAARLLDQKKNDEARMALMAALSTLVAIDRVTPLPLLLAREVINEAQRDKDRESALAFLNTARYELERAKALGYAAQDPEYKALKDDISNLEKQLKKNEDTSSLFSKLQERLSALLKRQSEGKQSRQDKSQREQSDREKRAA